MSKISDIRLGLRTFLDAFSFVRKNGLMWLFLIPVLVWLLFAGIFLTLGFELIPNLKAYLDTMLTSDDVVIRDGMIGIWDRIQNFFLGSAGWVVGFIAWALTAFIALFANKYLTLIVLSPVMAYASERTEEILTGNEYPFEWKQFFKDILRGILIALRNGAVEISISFVLWASTLFIPIMAPITAVLLFSVSSYFYGFSTFDYVHERRRSGVKESIRRIRADRWTVMANGALFNLLMKVPGLGMIMGPILASVGACMAFVEKSGNMRTTGTSGAY